MCKMSEYVSEPDRFLPHRWLSRHSDVQGGATAHSAPTQPPPYVSLPFGHGARTCIGKRFAETLLSVAACKILQNFDVTLVRASLKPLNIETKIFTVPAEPLLFEFTPRQT